MLLKLLPFQRFRRGFSKVEQEGVEVDLVADEEHAASQPEKLSRAQQGFGADFITRYIHMHEMWGLSIC